MNPVSTGTKKETFSMLKNRMMSDSLFKLEFAYYSLSLKSNQFPIQ